MKTKPTNIKTTTTSEPPVYPGILITNIVYAELPNTDVDLLGA
jgi:hypothetical protein